MDKIENQINQKVTFAQWKKQPVKEIFPGIEVSLIWQGKNQGKALMVAIKPGCKWQGVDFHETGSEEIFVVSGTFDDGERSYEAGTFIHYPVGSSHVPQSKTGCHLFVFYPD